jgi:predicted HTH domain antitoxin
MTHTTLQIQVPTPILRLGISHEDASERVTEWLVLSLFTDGHISSGKAAQLLDISRVEFLALLRKRGIAYLNYSEDELAEEWQAVANLPTPEAE